MSIILENQCVKAAVNVNAGVLNIEFADDPSFVRSESVVVDLMQRSIGLIFESAYHYIGDIPQTVGQDVEKITNARLTGQGSLGRDIALHAPVKIISTAA